MAIRCGHFSYEQNSWMFGAIEPLNRLCQKKHHISRCMMCKVTKYSGLWASSWYVHHVRIFINPLNWKEGYCIVCRLCPCFIFQCSEYGTIVHWLFEQGFKVKITVVIYITAISNFLAFLFFVLLFLHFSNFICDHKVQNTIIKNAITCTPDHFSSFIWPFRNVFERLLFTCESEMCLCCCVQNCWKITTKKKYLE